MSLLLNHHRRASHAAACRIDPNPALSPFASPPIPVKAEWALGADSIKISIKRSEDTSHHQSEEPEEKKKKSRPESSIAPLFLEEFSELHVINHGILFLSRNRWQ